MEGDATSRERLVNDLKTLVSDAEELLKATASQAGEKISEARQKIEQSLVEGKKALADAEQTLRQAVFSVLNTAADASPEQVEVEAGWDAQDLWIEVRDRGPAVGFAIGLLIRGR